MILKNFKRCDITDEINFLPAYSIYGDYTVIKVLVSFRHFSVAPFYTPCVLFQFFSDPERLNYTHMPAILFPEAAMSVQQMCWWKGVKKNRKSIK